MASYPTSIASFPSVTPQTGTNAPSHAGLHTQETGEIVAIETTLGINAQGTDGTVAAKLVRIDAQSSGGGYVPTSRTINGYPLTSNVNLTTADLMAIGTSALSTDGTMIADSDALVPTQKAVVTYVTKTGATVTNVSSATTSALTVANPTTTPTLTLNVGTGPNQVVQLNGSGQLPAVSGANLTNITPSSNANFNGHQLGTPLNPGYSSGTTYQATTDGFLIGSIFMQAGDGGNQSSGAYIYTSTTNPASISPNSVTQCYLYVTGGSTSRCTEPFNVPVAKNEYFEISLFGPDSSSISYAYFRPMGS